MRVGKSGRDEETRVDGLVIATNFWGRTDYLRADFDRRAIYRDRRPSNVNQRPQHLSSSTYNSATKQGGGDCAHLLCVLRVLLEVGEDLPYHRVGKNHLNLRVSHRVRRSLRIRLPRALQTAT